MAIDLSKLTPHKVSRDLTGYITYIYGPPKCGKTTLASQMPKPLLLAFERGYNAIPGIIAQDITSWSELKQVVRQLKRDDNKERFTTVCVDTVDLASILCDKYICNQNGVDKINDIPYGGGWTLLKKEFEGVFREITQLGYAVYFIAHSKEGTFKREDGSEYNLIRPSVSNTYNNIIENMADLIGYMHPVTEGGETNVKITFRSQDSSIQCGGRFKYIADEIDSNYDALVKALNDAIDKEAELTGNKFVTDEKTKPVKEEELDFDDLLKEFNEIVKELQSKVSEEEFGEIYAPKITHISDKYLGKGKKVNQCTRDQVEMLSLIVSEMKEL